MNNFSYFILAVEPSKRNIQILLTNTVRFGFMKPIREHFNNPLSQNPSLQ